jgi:hypothetical protein
MEFFEKIQIQVPPLSGHWIPLYIEPIVGSGERLTIAIAFQVNNQKFEIKQVIRQEVIDGIFGSSASGFTGIVDAIVEYYKSKCESIQNISSVKPPFVGIIIGSLTPFYAADMNGIMFQAVTASASLGSITFDLETESAIDDGKSSDRFASSIQLETVKASPILSPYFGRRLSVGNRGIQTKYGFVNGRYGANFGTISPAYVPQYANIIKARVLDLEALKLNCTEEQPTNFGMIVLRPEKNDLLISGKVHGKIDDTVHHLEDLSMSIGIELIEVFSPVQAANHLIKRAA